ncbi:Vacuolar morphogenesis protein 7 [Komagataella phaffii CBS 7435]|uniref:Uncharacterized protein n=2 Tax=Komagataella phaffii TaxID=460519 RepID=C4QYN0_KOMPG|nr:Hypothetical protein PAS_chr1-4_0500 [Komagataella phaffii GS115]AOA61573.1 GQ67_01649T0 [Komagataella phaffii]CAH2447179.1 Vacuolar morphogenesis protein 7 [Komagataella phaffii CBS 7435]AOA65563.1 GQ68_01665T0 [Komagataella phaffii GS115]CAY68354.1 Hypothetical protein PAS_chr1-4_0500 [Komagataella phaffii GS115]CCA37423.1 Vacuolar morphogenesis protein 7 [Komagataella phaffii CBS 7435]
MVSIEIPRTIESEGTTLYVIECTLENNRITQTRRRFSEFLALKTNLLRLYNTSSFPFQLPSKTLFKVTDETKEKRRVQLSNFLNDLVQKEEWRDNIYVREFLSLPNSYFKRLRNNQNVNFSLGKKRSIANSSEWLQLANEVRTLIQTGRTQLFAKQTLEARMILVGLQSKLQSLDPIPQDSLGAGELSKRKNMLVGFKRDYSELNSLLNELSRSSPQEESKPRLFNTRRVLGGPEPETDSTRPLENNELLQSQQMIMQTQDQKIEELRSAIQRQRELGTIINQEIGEQNELIDELDDQLDVSTDKMNIARQKVSKVLR